MENTEYRKALPEEGPRILDFINMVFSVAHEPHNFKKLLPKAYAHDDLWKLHYVAVREGQILATIALLPLTLTPVSGESLKIGFVGSVSVHPYCRSEGHMKALMSLLLQDARKEDYDLLMLGGQRQRYGYFGFGKADPILNYDVNRSNVRHALTDTEDAGISFEPLEEDMTETLERIRSTYTAGGNACERGDRLYEYLNGWKATPEVITENGRYVGYVCHHDTEIYELGLDEPGLFKNTVKAFVNRYGSMQGSLALHDSVFRKEVSEFAEEISLTDLAMIRIMNWPRVLNIFLSVKNGLRPIPDGTFSFSVKGEGSYRVTAKDGKTTAVAFEEESGLLLTPEKAVDLFFSVGGAINCTDPWLREVLPLPFHMGTMDHF